MKKLTKIIYFDRETISNILQESNKGMKISQRVNYSSLKGSGEIMVEGRIKLAVPFIERLGFLFSGKLSASYINQIDNTITISSTEISEFSTLKENLIKFNDIKVDDIENSPTFIRIASEYLKMMKGSIGEVDVKEFNVILNEFEGYDTYKITDSIYVRFNNKAFISNYKRNDLLTTKLSIYCIPVGKFNYNDFDFIQQIKKMEKLFVNIGSPSTLADLYPSNINKKKSSTMIKDEKKDNITENPINRHEVKLYDVLYASISLGDKDE